MTPSKEMMIDSTGKTPILAIDVIRSILERLNFVDFHRARCVSSAWYTASESCIQVTTTPWIILFSKEDAESNNGSCKLFDPLDKNSYTVKDLGSGFARSRCLSSSGSWFLMLGHKADLYLFNLFTRQKIPLPSVESVHGCNNSITIGSAVLWVDQKSRDYFVVYNFDNTFAYHKRGDNNESWKVFEPLKNRGCMDMVLKEGKLYVLSLSGNITVYEFSGGDSPMEYASFPSPDKYWPFPEDDQDYRDLKNLIVTLSGEVLVISRVIPFLGAGFIRVYKMDPKSSEWIVTDSIEDEALLFDLGITVEAKVMKNCIYLSNIDKFRRGYSGNNSLWKGICMYHIRTRMVLHVFDHLTASSPMHFEDARWFCPTFGGKWLH